MYRILTIAVLSVVTGASNVLAVQETQIQRQTTTLESQKTNFQHQAQLDFWSFFSWFNPAKPPARRLNLRQDPTNGIVQNLGKNKLQIPKNQTQLPESKATQYLLPPIIKARPSLVQEGTVEITPSELKAKSPEFASRFQRQQLTKQTQQAEQTQHQWQSREAQSSQIQPWTPNTRVVTPVISKAPPISESALVQESYRTPRVVTEYQQKEYLDSQQLKTERLLPESGLTTSSDLLKKVQADATVELPESLLSGSGSRRTIQAQEPIQLQPQQSIEAGSIEEFHAEAPLQTESTDWELIPDTGWAEELQTQSADLDSQLQLPLPVDAETLQQSVQNKTLELATPKAATSGIELTSPDQELLGQELLTQEMTGQSGLSNQKAPTLPFQLTPEERTSITSGGIVESKTNQGLLVGPAMAGTKELATGTAAGTKVVRAARGKQAKASSWIYAPLFLLPILAWFAWRAFRLPGEMYWKSKSLKNETRLEANLKSTSKLVAQKAKGGLEIKETSNGLNNRTIGQQIEALPEQELNIACCEADDCCSEDPCQKTTVETIADGKAVAFESNYETVESKHETIEASQETRSDVETKLGVYQNQSQTASPAIENFKAAESLETTSPLTAETLETATSPQRQKPESSKEQFVANFETASELNATSELKTEAKQISFQIQNGVKGPQAGSESSQDSSCRLTSAKRLGSLQKVSFYEDLIESESDSRKRGDGASGTTKRTSFVSGATQQGRSKETTGVESRSPSLGQDDLTKIRGIGVEASKLLRKSGINSFQKLYDFGPEKLKQLFSSEGSRFKFVDPSQWCEQAKFALNRNWRGLAKWQTDNSVEQSGAHAEEVTTTFSEAKTENGFFAQNSGSGKFDDLTLVRGIGKATQQVLRENGVRSFEQIAKMDCDQLTHMFAKFGDRFQLLDTKTWAQQAQALIENRQKHEGAEMENKLLNEIQSIGEIGASKANEIASQLEQVSKQQ